MTFQGFQLMPEVVFVKNLFPHLKLRQLLIQKLDFGSKSNPVSGRYVALSFSVV